MSERANVTAGSSPPAGENYRIIALIVGCAMFMENMDATILTTALPTMARDLGAPVTELSSALTAYLLALAVFIPASGRLADRFGSKTMFSSAIVVFLAGSLLCAQAPNVPILVAARFLQGMGGAMMVPIGRLVLLRSVARADMLRATSWLLVAGLMGPIVGPPLGGLVVTWLDWRWIFYLNLPIGLLGLGLVARYIRQIREQQPAPPDIRGFLLSGLCLGCLLFGFESSSRPGELVRSLVLILVGLVAGGLYVAHARRRENPILDLSLMRITTFRLAQITGALTRVAQGALPFLMPLMFQVGFGMSPATSGLITIAGAIGAMSMKGFAQWVLRRVGFRNCLIFNGLLASASYAACGAFRPSWPAPAMFMVLVLTGFITSLQFTAINTIVYDEIPQQRMSAATSFHATFQQLMLSVGVCVASASLHLATLFAGRTAPGPDQFTIAVLVTAGVSVLATLWNLRFPKDAGWEFSGR